MTFFSNKQSLAGSTRLFFLRLLNSIWLFPVLITVPLLVFTILSISGSSIGVYSLQYGNGFQDQGMIAGSPRGVRSDEWVVNTQMVVAQSQNNFQRVNKNIGNGQDMSLMADVPSKDWSAIFKPQDLAFFVLPLEHAFAFKWWFLGFVLVLSAYFLVLEVLPRRTMFAVLLASLVGLTPMVAWWYSSGAVLCIAYSLTIILLAIRLLKSKNRKAKLGYSLLLAYILVCFALLLYPPFQIPCFMAVVAFIAGWILENYKGRSKLKKLLSIWPYALLIFVLVATIGGLFYQTRKDVIHAVTSTAYPGKRVEVSGGVEPLLAFSSFLSPNLEYDSKAASGYLGNQSEASNFIFIAPYLFLPSLYLIFREKKRHNKILWSLIFVNLLIVFFLVRMYISTPWLEPADHLLLLDRVPGVRLLIGLGLAGLLQLMLIMKVLEKSPPKKPEAWLMALAGGLGGLAVMLPVGLYTIHHYPVFIASFAKVLLFSLWIAASIFLILKRHFTVGLALLVAFSLLSVYKVNPLYRGLGPVTKSATIQAIESYPNYGSWVVLDNRLLINFPIMAGKHSLNSVDFYPQLSLWAQIDKTKKYDNVYNRYAHVVFVDNKEVTEPFALKYADTVYVKFEPCKAFLQTNAKYVLSPKQLPQTCLGLRQSINLPQTKFYIYQIKPPVTP